MEFVNDNQTKSNLKESLLSQEEQQQISVQDDIQNNQQQENDNIQQQDGNIENNEDNNNIPLYQQPQFRRPSAIFLKAVDNLRIKNKIYISSNSAKILAVIVIFILLDSTCKLGSSLMALLISSCFIAVISIFYYQILQNTTKNKEFMLDIAEQLVHIQYINDSNQQYFNQPDLSQIIPNFDQMGEQEQQLFQQQLDLQKKAHEGFDYEDELNINTQLNQLQNDIEQIPGQQQQQQQNNNEVNQQQQGQQQNVNNNIQQQQQFFNSLNDIENINNNQNQYQNIDQQQFQQQQQQQQQGQQQENGSQQQQQQQQQVNLDNTEEKNRKISFLSEEIKYTIKKGHKIFSILGNSQFVLGFVWQICALVYFFKNDLQTKIFENYGQQGESGSFVLNFECQTPAYVFLLICCLMHLFQYFDFYLAIIIFVLASPIIIVFLIFYGIKTLLKKRKNNNFSKKLKPVKFKPDLIQGEPECSICMGEYAESEQLIFLPCEGKHHFHDHCIKEWLKVSANCPLCRKEFT